MTWQIHVFGVRHLSPTGAWHLRAFLDRTRPELVLIEGLDDATDLLPDITRKETQAADRHPGLHRHAAGAHARLPARALQPGVPGDLLGARARRPGRVHRPALRRLSRPAGRAKSSGWRRSGSEAEREEAAGRRAVGVPEPRPSLYEQIADLAGERDYDTYWERHFEHNPAPDSYRGATFELGRALRELEEDEPPSGGPRTWSARPTCAAGSRRRSRRGTSRSRSSPWSAPFTRPVLTGEFPAMTDEELASLPRRSSKLTLMPYSYFKLSSQSGYGAGNHAPAYFELLWEALNEHGVGDLSAPLPVARRPPPARRRHAPLDGRGDRRRAAGARRSRP